MPISANDLDLEVVIKQWLGKKNDYTMMLLITQSRTFFNDKSSLYAKIILYSTHFESITISKNGDKKYSFPIDNSGNNKLKEKLTDIIQKIIKEEDSGIGIGNIRNAVAHARNRKDRDKLEAANLGDLHILTECMGLVILGYVFTTLEIDESVILQFQNKLI